MFPHGAMWSKYTPEMASMIREFDCGLVVNTNKKLEDIELTEELAGKHRANLARAKQAFDPTVNIGKLVEIVERSESE